MKKLIIYFKEISARIDSAMTLQVLNDYGHLSNFNNKVILPIYAKTSHDINQIYAFLGEKKFSNLHLIVLPKSHKIIRSLFLIYYVFLLLFQNKFTKKVIVVREKKYLWLAKLIKRIFNVLLLVEFHETSLPEKETKKLHTKHQKLLTDIDGAIFTNPSQADYFKAYKYELPKNQMILPNGLSVKNYSKVKGASIKSHPVILTYTGQFTSWKNVPLIFEALQYLPQHFHLRIAGGKEDSELSKLYVDKLISHYSLAGRVKYFGFVHPSMLVKKVMNGSSILLLPLGNSNIAQYATSPMKLVEYMATPIPIVAIDAPSVRGLSGADSIFLSKLQAKDFSEIILKVYNLKSELLKKRVLKQNQIAKQYDFDVRAKKYNTWLGKLFFE
ncbi:glycosyltransferase family 4 protein [Candidatus Methylopumilus planktonicus]|uniref:glycosyltransferase family 4 protein n=1 Tax=Candidatus Methylopumilus planktonicus TaxID=1581557 RepID=UPI0011230647|nr:glycosyltransferase family 4 protein [Candidatus Methylopumilus planktonicus]QDD01818.1 glycosyltransferase family 4 protein [Candidatus Methylopumilus planktonicus]